MARIGIGLAFVALFASTGIVIFRQDGEFRESARSTLGTVYKNRETDDGNRPVVRYVDHKGQVQTFAGVPSPRLDPGEKVVVLFDPADPDSARIDTTLGRFGVPVLCGLAALLSLLFFVVPRKAK